MDNKILKSFKTPDAVYRSAPFWSWNDSLDVRELLFQVDMMQKGGFGGGFMHARMGLITPYLSKDWMECIKATARYAGKKGFKAYLYDEDRCSSGFASGMVTRNSNNRMRYIRIKNNKGRYSYSIVFGPDVEWYNGSTYVDIINGGTVKDFISSTYEPYFKLLGKNFGESVPAVFTDEPNYYRGNLYRWGKSNEKITVLPWTLDFEKIFEKAYGYDILANIPCLVEEKEGYEKVRYHYYRLLNRLLLENFGVQVYKWCDKRHIVLTGHYMGEENISSQIKNIGEAMCLYEYMHWPGIDYLGRKSDTPLIPKQCSSVAHQLSKERVLSELYGCSGQNYSLAERKRMGDWNIVLGVNFFCPHLYLYSLRGCRKRDYPPTISHHQPYWDYQRGLEDYFSRTNFLMSHGSYRANLLVVHPIESGWCVYGSKQGNRRDRLLESGWNSESNSMVEELDGQLSELTRLLLENKFEYDFGSEQLMEKYAGASMGKLAVGKGEYSAVVIPPAITLRRKTVELLTSFGKSGGIIYASDKFPYLVEGEKACGEILDGLKKLCVLYHSCANLVELLEKNVGRLVEIRDERGKNIPGIFVHARELKDKGSAVIFMANTSLEKGFSAVAGINEKGGLFRADAFTGELEKLPVSHAGKNKMSVELDFPPAGSHIVVLDRKEKPVLAGKKRPASLKKIKLDGWKVALSGFNVLVLDVCSLKKCFEDRWSKKMPAIKAQKSMEDVFNKQKICVLFEFDVKKSWRPDNLKLIVESAERYNISINGNPLNQKSSANWIDKCFNVLDIPDGFISAGRNSVLLETVFVPPRKKGTLIFKEGGTELENIYIAGNFSVEAGKVAKEKDGYFHGNLKIAPPKEVTGDSDINIQGFPFYTGLLFAEKEVHVDDLKKRHILQFDEFRCTAAGVRVNGKSGGQIFLPPYRLDITGLLKKGKNILSLECAGTLRNALGPFHQKEIEPVIVGPGSFEDFETDAYSNVPFGLGKISIVQEP
ncbi:MAG TPA: glycosyl hydrolase [bacterium]|nr:glycosyl hydrolase [bacterium]